MIATPSHRTQDRADAVLKYIHRLLLCETADSFPRLLVGLAEAYGALGAGVAAAPGGPGIVKHEGWVDGRKPSGLLYPWEQDPSLFDQTGPALDSVVIESADDANWLLAAVQRPGCTDLLIWVMDRGSRSWSPGERAVLPMVAQAWNRLTRLGAAPAMRLMEKERVHKAVEQAVKVAGRLAHDFGNYLTGILGFTELTVKQVPEGTLPYFYLNEVWRSAKEGAAWVHKLQTLSRGKAQRFEPTDLAPLVREEEDRIRPLLRGATSLAIALESSLPPVDIDRESLRQLLGHLLDNAREAIPDHGMITLAARTVHLGAGDCEELLGKAEPGDFVAITITDTGVGLAATIRQGLFTEFFVSTKPGRRGLGLLTVFWITQLYQGGLRIGPHPEQGTAVSVFLPKASR
jgi:signal transduction histidine kinase